MEDTRPSVDWTQDGIPIVNGQTPRYRIGEITPVYNGDGDVIDSDLELIPDNEAARLVCELDISKENGW